jgi:hypothetical protein
LAGGSHANEILDHLCRSRKPSRLDQQQPPADPALVPIEVVRDRGLHAAGVFLDEATLEVRLGKLREWGAVSLERRVLGPKSEKTPPPEKELRKGASAEDAEARRLAALERRRERAALKAQLRAETVIHHLADDQRQCPSCGGIATRPLGTGKQTHLYEYVPGYFVWQCHVQEKAACACGQSHRDRGSAGEAARVWALRRRLSRTSS